MKIKLENKGLTRLKGREDYRKWKTDVEILMMALGTKYLLTQYTPPPPPTPPPQPTAQREGEASTPTNISVAKGKGRVRDGDEGDDDDDGVKHISKERWENESESVVAQLYFYVDGAYQSIIRHLEQKTLPAMFAKLDALLLNNNMMVVMAKRSELEDIKFRVDSSFLQQIAKWEEVFLQYIEMGGEMSGSDKATNFAKALPFQYRKQLSDSLENTPLPHTFETMKDKISSIYIRESTWKILLHLSEGGPSLDTALYWYEIKKKVKGSQGQSGGNHYKSHNKAEKTDESNKLSEVTCFNCGKKEHAIKSCRKPITEETKQKLDAYKKNKSSKNKGGKKTRKTGYMPCILFE